MSRIEDVGTAILKLILPESKNYLNADRTSVSCSENEQSSVQLSLKSHSYTWTIENFSECLKFRNCQVESPSFIFQNTEWSLRLCVLTEKEKVKNMKIFLQNRNEIDDDLYFRNDISVLDDGGNVFSKADVEFCATDGNAVLSSPLYLLAPWGSDSFDLSSNKLVVRSEFSALVSEARVDTKSSLGESDNQNLSHSQSCTKDAPTVSPSPRKRTRHSVSSRSTSPRAIISAVLRDGVGTMLGLTCLLMMFSLFDPQSIRPANKQPDSIPSIKADEINHLIFDSTKKLSLVAEALNLTTVKEKSLEILASFSGMFEKADRVEPAKQSVESNETQCLFSKMSSFVASKFKQSFPTWQEK